MVVFANGELDVLIAGWLQAAIDKASEEADGRPVVVDLTAVTFLGSHGLAALADAASMSRASARGG
jgi:anti-anti-sigma factor